MAMQKWANGKAVDLTPEEEAAHIILMDKVQADTDARNVKKAARKGTIDKFKDDQKKSNRTVEVRLEALEEAMLLLLPLK